MDRRDAIRGIVLGSLTPIVVNAADSHQPSLLAGLVVQPQAVSTDMHVWQEVGTPQRFKLTLWRKPWPEAGQALSFEYEKLQFTGLVKRTEHRDATGRGAWVCDVEGETLLFKARDAFGG
jgi:hypothetical protein